MNATISARILRQVAMGATLEQAIDMVLGAGSFTKLAGEIYDALRKEG